MKTLPVGEFDWLDGQWIDEAPQYVSAIANFDGGYLIVGVRDPSATGEIQIDGGVRCSLKNGIKEFSLARRRSFFLELPEHAKTSQ